MDPGDLLPKRGRPPSAPITFEVIRDLTAEEILMLAMGDRPALAPPPLQQMRDMHYKIAHMMASGFPDKDIALAVGRTPQRIRDYRKDPMMKDAIAYYASQREEIDLRAEAQIRTDLIEIAQITTREILDRVEDPSGRAKIPLGDLRQISEMALDRTVAPKNNPQIATPPTHVTFNIQTKEIKDIKDITPNGNEPKEIEEEK